MGQRNVQDWKDKSRLDKVLFIAQIVLSAVVIILSIVKLAGIWDNALYVVEPLMGLVMFMMSWQNRNNNKILSLLCLAVGIFVIIVTIRIYMG